MRIFIFISCFLFTYPVNAEPAWEAEPTSKVVSPAFIKGRYVCARNVNAALANRGVKGTGSALAFSFLKWGKLSNPRPGAVRVSARKGGGHVMIVSHFEKNQWICLNPSNRKQRWQFIPCNSGNRAIAYRFS